MPNYAQLSKPLASLTKKYQHFDCWTEQQSSFKVLKDLLVSDRLVTHPRLDQPYLLYTDTSAVAIGAILIQKEEVIGIERPIRYLSRLLTSAQRRWSAVERECYWMMTALQVFKPYHYAADFSVLTDH